MIIRELISKILHLYIILVYFIVILIILLSKIIIYCPFLEAFYEP